MQSLSGAKVVLQLIAGKHISANRTNSENRSSLIAMKLCVYSIALPKLKNKCRLPEY
jgi:hypothetical protein